MGKSPRGDIWPWDRAKPGPASRISWIVLWHAELCISFVYVRSDQATAGEVIERYVKILKCRMANPKVTAVVAKEIFSKRYSFCYTLCPFRDRLFNMKVEPWILYIAPGVQPSSRGTPVITSATVSLNGYLNMISYFTL